MSHFFYALFIVGICIESLLLSVQAEMISLKQSSSLPVFPFILHGDCNTQLGSTIPDALIDYATELRIHGLTNIKEVSTEFQVNMIHKSIINTPTNYFHKESLLGKATDVSTLAELVADPNDTSNTVFISFVKLLTDSTINPLLQTVIASKYIPKLTILLDRANIKYRLKRVSMAIGIQLIAWGSGYAWNPIDIFNIKNPLDPTSPRLGVGAITCDAALHERFLLSSVFLPESRIDECTGGFRAKYFSRKVDIAVCSVYKGGKLRKFLNISPQYLLGFDCNVITGTNGNWWSESEMSFKFNDSSSIFEFSKAQLVSGYQHAFSNTIRALIEVYLNNSLLDKDDNQKAVTIKLMDIAIGDRPSISGAYAAGALIYNPNNYVNTSLLTIYNIADNSCAFSPILSISPVSNLKIECKGFIFVGDYKTTEFGSFKHRILANCKYLF